MASKVLLTGFLASLGQYATAQTDPVFDWTTVKPSTSLDYTSCYGTLKCAKLTVPLDWLNNSTGDGANVNLAIVTLPATVPESDPTFGGTIIVNPGGPGGSGVAFLLENGHLVQDTADGNKHYEILSFDPRGIGYSEPKADCYDNELARKITTLQLRAMGSLDSGIDAVRRQRALFGAHGRLCEASGDIQRYMSTASVVRDMVEIVDKLDELRNKNSTSSAKFRARGRGPQQMQSRQEEDDLPRIQYWGFSYGTVIGNYFASMYPGRVGRMILEGVVDVHDYNSALWSKSLQDTQEEFATFWTTCFAGGSSCPLYQSDDTGPADIERRVRGFLADIEASPAQYVSGSHIEEITKSDIMAVFFNGLYQPIQYFPGVAAVVAEAMAGNFSLLYSGLAVPEASAYCEAPAQRAYTWTLDAEIAVACGDAPPQDAVTTEQLQAHVAKMTAESPDFGASWSQLRIACPGWRVRPPFRFEGPFTSPAASADASRPEPGRPAAPLLFLSSRLDPVTPYASAARMAAEHPGSGLLVQESTGHVTLVTPGKCRDDYVKKYFETGEIPPKGATCEPDCAPFAECPQTLAAKRSFRTAAKKGGAPVLPPMDRPPLGLMW